jgi:hypothetical protein
MRALPAVQSASTAAYFERYENSRSHRVNAHPATRHGHYRIALGFTYTFPESRHKRRRASSAFDQPPTGIWSGKGKNVLAIGHNRQVAARRGGVCRKACRAIPRRLVREPGGLRATASLPTRLLQTCHYASGIGSSSECSLARFSLSK